MFDLYTLHAPERTSQQSDRSKQAGLFVATAGRDKLIKIWDASTGQLIRTLVNPNFNTIEVTD